MDSYNSNTVAAAAKANELSTFNYASYATPYSYENANADQQSNYNFANTNQYLYNYNYASYYPQYGNYGAYSYYPQYQQQYAQPSVEQSTPTVLTDVKVANTSQNEDYTTVSPIPTNGISEQSTPITTMSSMSSYYATPPTDLSSSDSESQKDTLKKFQSKRETSPEIVPKDDSNDDSNGDDNMSANSRMKRRTRTQFSKFQIDYLESVFNKNHYPDVQTVDLLSEKLGLAIERISVWFQNRRAKFKKTKKPSNFSAERLYTDDRTNARTISLSSRDPVGFQKFANNLAPKPTYPVNGLQSFQNQSWPNFNPNLIQDRLKN